MIKSFQPLRCRGFQSDLSNSSKILQLWHHQLLCDHNQSSHLRFYAQLVIHYDSEVRPEVFRLLQYKLEAAKSKDMRLYRLSFQCLINILFLLADLDPLVLPIELVFLVFKALLEFESSLDSRHF